MIEPTQLGKWWALDDIDDTCLSSSTAMHQIEEEFAEVPVPKDVIGGYLVERRIALTQMSVVYSAFDPEFVNREVIIKTARQPPKTGGRDEKQVVTDAWAQGHDTTTLVSPGANSQRALQREWQILGTISHPHVPRILTVGEDEDLGKFFVLEYVHGVDLATYCHDHALSLAARYALFEQVIDAVNWLHQHGIVHGDLKPANILVTERGGVPWVMVIDYGVSGVLDPDFAEALGVEPAAKPVGMTPRFAAPGSEKQSMSYANDVYSLALIWFELVTCGIDAGFDEDSPADDRYKRLGLRFLFPTMGDSKTLGDLLGLTPERAHQLIHGEMDNVFKRAFQPDPAMRYTDSLMLSHDIHKVLVHGGFVGEKLATALYKLPRRTLNLFYTMRWGTKITVVVFLIGLLFLAGYAVYLIDRETKTVVRLTRKVEIQQRLMGELAATKGQVSRVGTILSRYPELDAATTAEAVFIAGELAFKHGLVEDARVHFQRAYALYSQIDRLPKARLCRLHFYRAHLMFQAGDHDGGRRLLRGVLNRFRKAHDAGIARVLFDCELLLVEDALAHDLSAAALLRVRRLVSSWNVAADDSQKREARLLLVKALVKQGLYEEVLEVVGGFSMPVPVADLHLVIALHRLGRFDEALAVAQSRWDVWAAEAPTPVSIKLGRTLTCVLRALGRHEAAVRQQAAVHAFAARLLEKDPALKVALALDLAALEDAQTRILDMERHLAEQRRLIKEKGLGHALMLRVLLAQGRYYQKARQAAKADAAFAAVAELVKGQASLSRRLQIQAWRGLAAYNQVSNKLEQALTYSRHSWVFACRWFPQDVGLLSLVCEERAALLLLAGDLKGLAAHWQRMNSEVFVPLPRPRSAALDPLLLLDW